MFEEDILKKKGSKIINISIDKEQEKFHEVLLDEYGHGSISKFIRGLEKDSKRFKEWKKRNGYD